MEGRSPENDDPGAEPIQIDAEKFPCAQCGAQLSYDPAAQALACGYCGNIQPAPEIAARDLASALQELDYAAALRDAIDDAEIETTHASRCDNCGAHVGFEPGVTATDCPFCASPLVAMSEAHRHFRPKAVAPFLVPEREARKALGRWLGSRWFAPGDLSEAARAGRPMTGVYLPYWTFDAATASRYDGERGDIHHVWRWVTVMKDGARRRVRRKVAEIRWRRRSGRVSRQFDDVLVLASKSLPPSLASQLSAHGAFDLDGLRPYAPAYLAGFGAETYRVDLQEGYAAAQGVMGYTIRRDVRMDIGGDRQRVRRIETAYSDVTFKHVLLPIWIAAYRYRGKVYRYLVNGRTGQVMGERPWSWTKIFFSTVALLAAGGVLFFILSYLEG